MSVRGFTGLTTAQKNALMNLLDNAAYATNNSAALIQALDDALSYPETFGLHRLYLGGVDLTSEFHIYVSGKGTYNGAPRTYEPQQIRGRNGDLLLHENRLENTELTYHCFFPPDTFELDIEDFRDYILGTANIGYQKIADTYHPDEFRLGYYQGPFEPEVMDGLQTAEFDLTFIVKPQRFLTDGANPIICTENTWIENPTFNDSLPTIWAFGTGTFRVMNVDGNGTVLKTNTINVKNNLVYTIVDSSIQDCYEGSTNRNGDTVLSNQEFPTLINKANGCRSRIVFPSGTKITSIHVMPNWYRV